MSYPAVVDSTNFTLSASTDAFVSYGAGYDYVEVRTLNATSGCSYKIATGTNDVTTLAADHWNLPAATNAYRTHCIQGLGAFNVSVVSGGACAVEISAWRAAPDDDLIR
jgi:hypothetical protein